MGNTKSLSNRSKRKLHTLKGLSLKYLEKCRMEESLGGRVYAGELSMGEALLAMDRYCRIPRYSKYTVPVFTVAEALVGEFVHKLESKWNYGTIESHLIGSYKTETKILRNNEFDFLLVAYPRADDNHHIKVLREYSESMFQSLQATTENKNHSSNPEIIGVFYHAPAWCVEVGWLFEENGQTEMCTFHIDVTLGIKNDVCPHGVQDDFESRKTEVEVCLKEDQISTVLLDADLLSETRNISPNIIAAYRLLKVFVCILLPQKVKHRAGASGGATLSNGRDSHEILDLVLSHSKKHPSTEDWSSNNLGIRLAKLVRELADRGRPDADFQRMALSSLSDYIKRGKVRAIDTYIRKEASFTTESYVLNTENIVPKVITELKEFEDLSLVFTSRSPFFGQSFPNIGIPHWCEQYLHEHVANTHERPILVPVYHSIRRPHETLRRRFAIIDDSFYENIENESGETESDGYVSVLRVKQDQ